MAGALSALEAIGTGFGQGAEAIQQQQRTAAQLALQKVALQQAQARQQSMAAMLPGLVAAYGQGQQQQPKMPPGPPTGFTGPGYTAPPPMGTPTALGPPAASPAGGAGVPVPPSLAPIYARESGFNPTARNRASSASGSGQDIKSTWDEAMQGLGYGNAYPTAASAPSPVQNAANIWIQARRGNKPWAASAPPGTGMTGAGQSAVGGFSPELVAQGRQAATTAAQDFDPMEYGRIAMQRAVEAIDAQDIPPEAKSMAIVQMAQIIQPQDRMMLSMYMQQNRDLIAQARLHQGDERIQQGEERIQQLEEREAKGSAAGGSYEASKTLEILDKDENVKRTVLAREGRGKVGWVDSVTGEPLKLEPGEHPREITPTTSSGGRTGAQVIRQEIGGREVVSDLQNAVSLPIGQTIGPLGTVETGKSISEALKGDTVRAVTPQEAQLMQASMASMTRELSILMSPVYGGNWAAQQMEPLIPKAGDTVGTTQFKLGRMAQTADNALEALEKAPALSNDQKQYAKSLRAQIKEAIPWSTAEAQGFARFAGEGEPFGAFVDRWRQNIPEGSKPVPGKTVNGMPVFAAPDGTFHSLDAPPDASHP
jgi:hypothetical protein